MTTFSDLSRHLIGLSNLTFEAPKYPPYNIEIVGENKTAIVIAVAGFSRDELDVQLENNVLSVRGKLSTIDQKTYQHRGIATRDFKHLFQLMEGVRVTDCSLDNGLLTVNLEKEIPERLKPKSIPILQRE